MSCKTLRKYILFNAIRLRFRLVVKDFRGSAGTINGDRSGDIKSMISGELRRDEPLIQAIDQSSAVSPGAQRIPKRAAAGAVFWWMVNSLFRGAQRLSNQRSLPGQASMG